VAIVAVPLPVYGVPRKFCPLWRPRTTKEFASAPSTARLSVAENRDVGEMVRLWGALGAGERETRGFAGCPRYAMADPAAPAVRTRQRKRDGIKPSNSPPPRRLIRAALRPAARRSSSPFPSRVCSS
jgi:hypothetical protein